MTLLQNVQYKSLCRQAFSMDGSSFGSVEYFVFVNVNVNVSSGSSPLVFIIVQK